MKNEPRVLGCQRTPGVDVCSGTDGLHPFLFCQVQLYNVARCAVFGAGAVELRDFFGDTFCGGSAAIAFRVAS